MQGLHKIGAIGEGELEKTTLRMLGRDANRRNRLCVSRFLLDQRGTCVPSTLAYRRSVSRVSAQCNIRVAL